MLAKALYQVRSGAARKVDSEWDTYYLKIATTHFAACCADIERRQIGVVDELRRFGGVPGLPRRASSVTGPLPRFPRIRWGVVTLLP